MICIMSLESAGHDLGEEGQSGKRGRERTRTKTGPLSSDVPQIARLMSPVDRRDNKRHSQWI